METQSSAQFPFQKSSFGSNSQKTRKSRYQTFLVLSSFTGFLYFVPNILPRIVVKNPFPCLQTGFCRNHKTKHCLMKIRKKQKYLLDNGYHTEVFLWTSLKHLTYLTISTSVEASHLWLLSRLDGLRFSYYS